MTLDQIHMDLCGSRKDAIPKSVDVLDRPFFRLMICMLSLRRGGVNRSAATNLELRSSGRDRLEFIVDHGLANISVCADGIGINNDSAGPASLRNSRPAAFENIPYFVSDWA